MIDVQVDLQCSYLQSVLGSYNMYGDIDKYSYRYFVRDILMASQGAPRGEHDDFGSLETTPESQVKILSRSKVKPFDYNGTGHDSYLVLVEYFGNHGVARISELPER